ncbi:Ig-like domain repeat protein [Streptomyces sp. W16]|uniref:YncE family protein n=1 Tax=Streptomyces sp. W16 TaxID=3076631 RepID=UPI00295BCF03|nr:Ig-like domain repeat protein [Streptomyces sp. W16]MDV9173646.1 Ig-like domain repeat protein [Streptomyces sp. W16]
MRSISTATALAVLFGSAALSVVATGTASAATANVASPGGLVADGALKRVFVGDSSAGTVAATDYSGNVLASVGGISGVSDLTVSDDGATVYAAAQATHEIVAIDAATLDVKARYAVTTGEGPRYLAFSAGKVWFTYGDQWDGNLGSVDPATDPAGGTDPVTLGQMPEGVSIWDPGFLDTAASRPGVLAVGETGVSTDSMVVLDVSGTTPQKVAYDDRDSSLHGEIYDIDLVPGADEVLVDGTLRDAYADGKFSRTGSYPGAQRADIAADGTVAQVNGSTIATYRPNATKAIRTYNIGVYGTADLTWAPDDSRIFALVGKSGGGYTLKALTDPEKNVPTLTVNAPSSATRAKKLTVTGKLSATVALPAGVKLQVTRTDLESPKGKALPAVTVKADGTYSFADTPPAGGTVTYKVAYAGDAGHAAVSASDKVSVSRAATTLSLNNNGKLYSYGADVKFTAHLGKTYKNRTVAIYSDPFGGDKPKKLVKTGKVNSSGNITVTVDMTRDTAVSAVFAGDARYASKTVKVTAYAKVRISTAITKHYKTAKIGSTSYYWFHKNSAPIATTTMTYYPNRQERLDLQVYYNGRWYDSDSEYFGLGTSGKVAVNLGAPGESGIRARIRAAYINGSSGDNVNSTTYSGWKYIYFSN